MSIAPDNPQSKTDSFTTTTCPYCGVGCGVRAHLDQAGVVTVTGDQNHPANHGRLCSKGTALGETVYLNERLLYPEIMGQQVSWEQALSTAAGRFKDIIEEHGKDAVAFYVSGQLLTEDYYVANKLMKGFIGSANIDTNSRLCMSSAVAGYKRAFGEDIVPCNYEDLEKAKLIVLTGSNTAWCHPVLYQRIVKAKKLNPDLMVITIDPRTTQTASVADLHLAITPGQDSVLFNGLLVWLEQANEINHLFVSNFTRHMEPALETARQSSPSIEHVATQCGLSVKDVEQFYRLFARTERTVSVFSQGINQSSSGTDKVNSIINCHLFTGRIGRPGMGPFSFTGQPNAMGGREVGGLSNQLAAHMEIASPLHRQRLKKFWNASRIAEKEGYKAVDLFDAIHAGKVKAVWIMATNPVVSFPDADKVIQALQQCELVIASDCVAQTDTTRLAHICFPATTWGERNGTVTNSERCISRQQAFLEAPGLARHDWWIISQFAREMGYGEAFDYQHPADIFREHARLSGFENDNERLFNISGLSNISNQEYNELKPLQWPVTAKLTSSDCSKYIPRPFSDGHFYTADNKAHFIAVKPQLPMSTTNQRYPYVLNTGRSRDHWHTMTRTGMSPRLSAHTIEPYAEIHPDDAAVYSLREGELVKISSPLQKSIIVRVRLSKKQQPGSLFVPIHWNQQFSSRARVGSLIKAALDPVSGQPESKHSIARIEPYKVNWYAFMVTRLKPELKYSKYWARSRGKGFWRYELAGQQTPDDWSEHAHSLLELSAKDENWIEFYDKNRGHYRAANLTGNRLDSCVFIYPGNNLPPRDWLISLFHKDEITALERANLLRGEPPADQADTGKIICACFNVGEKTISESIKHLGLSSVEAIGEHLQAGTNCGSCKPEIMDILNS